jgi:hypothetical protein
MCTVSFSNFDIFYKWPSKMLYNKIDSAWFFRPEILKILINNNWWDDLQILIIFFYCLYWYYSKTMNLKTSKKQALVNFIKNGNFRNTIGMRRTSVVGQTASCNFGHGDYSLAVTGLKNLEYGPAEEEVLAKMSKSYKKSSKTQYDVENVKNKLGIYSMHLVTYKSSIDYYKLKMADLKK